jgi:signal transduction histidine kinase
VFLTANGSTLSAPRLAQALDQHLRTLRLERPEAVALGLPERMAIAGFSTLDAGPHGIWGIAMVATAFRERDRERRAALRTILAILLATALVAAFGGLALRVQREELRLQKDLELAELARIRDERLERLGQAATMLTMASGVAHEIGTPLGVIVGRAEQLLDRASGPGGDEKARRAAQAILDQAQSISEVVRGFLGLARGGAPALQLIPPAKVASSALALVEHRFAHSGVALSASVGEGLPPLQCDPRLLEHALVNLLLNACDACPRGGQVELSAEAIDGAVSFSVVDDGAGISSADAARVTEPFFTTKPAGQGTGLGLAIVSEIAKSHHGSLSVVPAKPRGTRASVRIPLGADQTGGPVSPRSGALDA